MLRNLSPWEVYLKYHNFPTRFSLPLPSECFGQILRQSVKSTYPINSFKDDILYRKSSPSFCLGKVCKQHMPPQEIITPHQVASQSESSRTPWLSLLCMHEPEFCSKTSHYRVTQSRFQFVWRDRFLLLSRFRSLLNSGW